MNMIFSNSVVLNLKEASLEKFFGSSYLNGIGKGCGGVNKLDEIKSGVWRSIFFATHLLVLRINTAKIVLLGHSMGDWICLKALQELPKSKGVLPFLR